ncbi:hypothetical protein KBB45_09345 [Myxococcota bacterium]|nr:hypothetical protein [Myxococcota bacterium]MBP8972041.1 hypothetical protein [Myxococcota bacterium]
MRKTFLAIGSALLLALTFAACDMGEGEPEPEAKTKATAACRDYRTDLGNYYVDTCKGWADEAGFVVWFTEYEADCDEARWAVDLTDLQETHWVGCLEGIGKLTEADCEKFFPEDETEAKSMDQVVPQCKTWWPPKPAE